MAANKEKPKQITSPAGLAHYPRLSSPDTKFDPDGEYRVGVILPSADAQELIQTLDQAMVESLEKAKKENPQKAKKIKSANPPYSEMTDDEGNETGDILFNFKMKAKITPRNGGEPFEIRPALFDAKGQKLPKDARIGGGSKLKVCADVVPYFTDLVGAGITLRLKAVQVLELVEYNSQSPERYGFGVEEGYDASSSESANDSISDDEADF